MSTYPPLPDVPACWSWELPPLPQPSHLLVVKRWQVDRCAICGLHRPDTSAYPERMNGLFEDHCHSTGDTRGFLCPRCNTSEGKNPHPVFQLYRERYPTKILGVLHRKGCNEHPVIRDAEIDWVRSFDDLRSNTEALDLHRQRLDSLPVMRDCGLVPADWVPELKLRPVTLLMEYLQRVGLTWDEWYGPNHRWRLRRGMDSGSTDWRSFMREELIRWARERRAGLETRDPGGHYYSQRKDSSTLDEAVAA